jgi:hypothetical protein
VGSRSGSEKNSYGFFSYPDPKLGGKWDPDPDPKKIVKDPQHWLHMKRISHQLMRK